MSFRNLEDKSIIEAVTDLVSLKEVITTHRNDNVIVNSNLGLFSWSSTSTEVPDDTTVILPNDVVLPDPGRWLKIFIESNSFWKENVNILSPVNSSNIVQTSESFRVENNGSYSDLKATDSDGLSIDTSNINPPNKFRVKNGLDDLIKITDIRNIHNESYYYKYKINGIMECVLDYEIGSHGALVVTTIPGFIGTIYAYENTFNVKAQIDCKNTTLSTTIGGSFIQSPLSIIQFEPQKISLYFTAGWSGLELQLSNNTESVTHLYISLFIQKWTS